MSQSADKLKQVRLSADNHRHLKALSRKMKPKLTLTVLANEAIELGLPKLSENIFRVIS